MATDTQNAGQLHSIDFAPTTQMGKVGVFPAKERASSTNPNSPWVLFSDQPVLAMPVVNRTGNVILRGRRCIFGTANEGPFKCVSSLATVDQAGDGCAPWEIPAAGVPNGSTFYLITSGPAKLAFDGVDVAIAAGDRIGPGASGLSAKWGSGRTIANATHTNTTTDADLATKTIPANTLKPYDEINIFAAGYCSATNSTDTLTNILKFATQTVGSTGAIDVANNDPFVVSAKAIVRSIGATGIIAISGYIQLKTTTVPFAKLLTVDTTAAIAIAVNADWSVADPGNIFLLTQFGVKFDGVDGIMVPFGRALEAVSSSAADAELFKAMVDFRTMVA